MRGRIFATQVVSANFISLLPLLMVGVMTDMVGTAVVLLLLSVMVAIMALISARVGNHEDDDEDNVVEQTRKPHEVATS